MQGLHAIAAEHGCSRMERTTDNDNELAKAFYTALGAKPRPAKVFYRTETNAFAS